MGNAVRKAEHPLVRVAHFLEALQQDLISSHDEQMGVDA